MHSTLEVGTQTVERYGNGRRAWTVEDILALIRLPLPDLLFQAQTVHRQFFDPCAIQLSTLASIKTGGCPENCGYCSQSAHFKTGLKADKLLDRDQVLQKAKAAKAGGATRFCMGAAWSRPKNKDLDMVCSLVKDVKALGLETCATLGMLTEEQADRLSASGLDYYNHNLDTSAEYYPKVVTTRTYSARLETLSAARKAGLKLCCGGIFGLGETVEDQAALLSILANLPVPPESVPLNRLVPVVGTPLAESEPVDTLQFVRLIAAARICLPKSFIRLSAGRNSLCAEAQALCFLAGANSVFWGEQLLTTPNSDTTSDEILFKKLGLYRQA